MIARGTVLGAAGGLVSARLPGAVVGAGVRLRTSSGSVAGIVTALRSERTLIAAYDALEGLRVGDDVYAHPTALMMPLGMPILGRAIDAAGTPLDGGPPIRGRATSAALHAPEPSQRKAVRTAFWTGIRTVDALLTVGRGARIGIFGPPGCGKSTLLHSLIHASGADAVVVGLVGERGREAEEWVRVCPPHACVVCATSDRSPAQRIHAARVAMAQAHALRSRGLHVLLVLDSLARYAAALREVALACGESVGRAGYPASVFAELARFLEVAGACKRGSITLVGTVLSDGDERDPVSDAARSLLDGHIALSPKLAHAGRFPAIDLLASASRTMGEIADPVHLEHASAVRRAVSVLAQSEDARSLGIAPTDAFAVRAIAAEPYIDRLLRQGKLPSSPAQTLSALAAVADILR